jgi:hypothetical protein
VLTWVCSCPSPSVERYEQDETFVVFHHISLPRLILFLKAISFNGMFNFGSLRLTRQRTTTLSGKLDTAEPQDGSSRVMR